MESSLGLVWVYGKYSCLGKSISWLEMNEVFFELLKRFDFELIDPINLWKSENVGLWMQSEMFAKITERFNWNGSSLENRDESGAAFELQGCALFAKFMGPLLN